MKKLIQDIVLVQNIQNPKKVRKIPLTIFEEVKYPIKMFMNKIPVDIVWVDNNGINTPYRVTVI